MIKLAKPCVFKLEKLRLQSTKRIEFEYADYIKGKKSQSMCLRDNYKFKFQTTAKKVNIRIKQVTQFLLPNVCKSYVYTIL